MTETTSESRAESLRRLLPWGLLLFGLVWLLYARSLGGPFVFDDWHVLPQNPAVHDLGNVPDFFTDPSTFSVLEGNRDYRPVFLTAAAIEWSAGGGSPAAFKGTSVALHSSVAVLVFLVLLATLRWTRGSAGPGEQWTALLGAAIFALHPAVTEAVNYPVQQAELWTALFYLGSFLLFLRAHARRPRPRGPRLAAILAGSYAAYFLALLSKPVGITLVLVLVLWELLLGDPERERPLAEPGRWAKLVPYAIVSALYLAIRATVLEQPFGGEAVRSRYASWLTQTKALVFHYLGSAAWPTRLNVDREYPVSDSILDPMVLASLAVLAGMGWLLYRYRRERLIVFWALWFPAAMFVTSYGVVLGQVVNDHRIYLSLVGFAAVVAILVERLWSAFPLTTADLAIGKGAGRRGVAVIAVVILLAMGWGTLQRNEVWASNLSLWRDAATRGGTWRAHMNYALALESEGRGEEALAEFETAVEMGPYAWAHLNLGNAYVGRGRIVEGLEHLERAVELWPTLPEARAFLGYGFQRAGRLEEAERELRQAIELRPSYGTAHRLLGQLYEVKGEFERAAASYEALARLDPRAEWPANRARLLRERAASGAVDLALGEIRARRYDAAVAVLERSLERAPGDPDVLFNLAFSHQMSGGEERAIELYERLLEIEPDHRKGLFNLGYAYLQQDSREGWERSVELFGRVVEVDPSYTEALHRLATAYWKLGNEAEARRYDRLFLERGGHVQLEERSRERLGGGAGS